MKRFINAGAVFSVMMLKQVRRRLSDDELVAEIDEAMKAPEFRKAIREFVKITSG